MRTGFAHEALIEFAPDSDQQAPGAAVTVALCGHWEHEGQCRWPHHTSVDVSPAEPARLRVVFASSAEDEPAVRRLIHGALDRGRLGTEPGTAGWTVMTQGRSGLRPEETALADRLIGS